MEPSEQHIRTLAAKLDALELSSEEKAALGYLLTASRTVDAEVEGFGQRNIFVQTKGFNIGMSATSLVLGDGNPLTSSFIVLGESDMRGSLPTWAG